MKTSMPYLIRHQFLLQLISLKGMEMTTINSISQVNIKLLPKVSSFISSLVDVFATFFVFDMSYPMKLNPLMVFIQHYILELKDEQTESNNVKILLHYRNKFNSLYALII